MSITRAKWVDSWQRLVADTDAGGKYYEAAIVEFEIPGAGIYYAGVACYGPGDRGDFSRNQFWLTMIHMSELAAHSEMQAKVRSKLSKGYANTQQSSVATETWVTQGAVLNKINKLVTASQPFNQAAGAQPTPPRPGSKAKPVTLVADGSRVFATGLEQKASVILSETDPLTAKGLLDQLNEALAKMRTDLERAESAQELAVMHVRRLFL